MLREPAVQGMFYPAKKEQLEKQLQDFFSALKPEHRAKAVVSPHAGYIYSGRLAARAMASLKKAKTYFILSPNHTGFGPAISVYPEGKWVNCLGQVKVNEKLATGLVEKVKGAEADELAHIQEHSIEVLLPFLQFLFQDFEIVPITLAEHDFSRLKELAQAIFQLSQKNDLAVIASSDFTHFQPEEKARELDLKAIALVTKLKTEAFYQLIREERLSICGFAPIIVAMLYSRLQGLKKGQLIEYSSSAETTGDKSNVVGYAAIKFT